MKKHETTVCQILLSQESCTDAKTLMQKHERIIGYMQHERLAHLIVMLAFGFFLLATIVGLLVKPIFLMKILSAFFFALLIPYIVHYFFLENAIQRWYELTDRLEAKSNGNTPMNKRDSSKKIGADPANGTDSPERP